MAEVFGIVAGIVQIVGFGLSTASGLHEISQGVSAYSERIERLADHVKANSRVLDQLAELLRDDAAAGQRLNASFQADVEFAAHGCRRVFKEIEILLQKQRVSRLDKLKYTLFDEPQVEGFRSELSQCQITLNLMLLIHWQKDVAQTRRDVMDLLRGNLDTAKSSNVPSIAVTVNKLVEKVVATDMGDAAQSTESFTKAGESEKFDMNTQSAPAPAGQETNPSMNSGTSSSGHLFNSFIARPRSPNRTSNATSRNPPSSSPTLTSNDNDNHSSRNEYCMWSAHVEKDRRISFEKMRLTPDRVDEFVTANAGQLVETLAKLERYIKSAINEHAQKMDHDVVAVVPHHRRSAFRMAVKLSSLDVATKSAVARLDWKQYDHAPDPTSSSLGGFTSMLEPDNNLGAMCYCAEGQVKKTPFPRRRMRRRPFKTKATSDSIASSSAAELASTAGEHFAAAESQQKASREKRQEQLHEGRTTMPHRINEGRTFSRHGLSESAYPLSAIATPISIDRKTYGKEPNHDQKAVTSPESHSDEDIGYEHSKTARPRSSEEEKTEDARPLNPDDVELVVATDELIATLARRWNPVAPEESLHGGVA